MEEPSDLEPPALGSPQDSICEDEVTLALKELDERCEEEEADFSDLSRLAILVCNVNYLMYTVVFKSLQTLAEIVKI